MPDRDKQELEAGELYKGPCGLLKDSNWLNAETLPNDKDTIVQIEAVIRRKAVKLKNETKKGYGSLRFKGKDRELGLNATHLKVLSALFGNDTSAWYGKFIALYVDPAVNAFGQIVSAVRIRARRVEPPSREKVETKQPKPSDDDFEDQPPLTEEEMAANDARIDAENAKKGKA